MMVPRRIAYAPHANRNLGLGVCISPEAMADLRRWVQLDDGDEAGGVLIGRYLLDGGIAIDGISTPGPRDFREPFYFFRHCDHHNAAVRAAWEASNGTAHYLGNWHTHPEPVPTPSPLDLSEWARDAAEIRAQHGEPNLPLAYLILGQSHVGVWAVGDPSMKTEAP